MQTNIENAIDSSKVPTGGATGQILAKKSNADNDVEWVFNDGGVTGDTLPIGAITEWGSDTVPLNWLLCNGQAVSRTTYQNLFNTIGTTYGTGDGFTTFNLPDLRKRVAVGKDSTDSDFNALGNTGGEKTHVLTENEMPSHQHNVEIFGDAGGPYGYNIQTLSIGSQQNVTTDAKGGNQAHNNLQPYITLNFIIKAKQSAGVIAQVLQESDTANTLDVYSSSAVDNIIEGISNRLYSQLEQATNIDTLKENGKYGIFNATGTLPSGYSSSDNNIIIECIMWSSEYGRQILHDVRTTNTYIRIINNNSWHSWYKCTLD